MVLIRCGVVTDLAASDKPKTAGELAEGTGASERLIVRMMRPLTATGVFREAAEHTYAATPISHALATPALTGGFQFMFDYATRSLANMPRCLEKAGFRDVDGPPGPFQDCNGTDELMFPYLARDQGMMAHFNHFMSGSLATRADWFDKFDAEAIVLAGAEADDPDATLLVDIAGGGGHDVEAFSRAFPLAPGRLVLQDLPAVIAGTGRPADGRVARQAHDMFTEQPVRGARAYYVRNVFHNWPDDGCVEVMRRTAGAMARGYSKLLIFEWVLPARGVPLYPALLDVNMMALLNGRQRTAEEWAALLRAAGLKIVKIHQISPREECLIEAELA